LKTVLKAKVTKGGKSKVKEVEPNANINIIFEIENTGSDWYEHIINFKTIYL